MIISHCKYAISILKHFSNVLTIPVKMFFNHLTAWLKQHRKKTLNRTKKFKTRLMVQNKKKQAYNDSTFSVHITNHHKMVESRSCTKHCVYYT